MRDDLGFILDHKVPGNVERHEVAITVQGEPGAGGAFRLYVISSANGQADTILQFQEGGIPDNGINGITNEALLAVVMDRLRDFQAGPFACGENAMALIKVQEAMLWLHHRTTGRIRRGVEGKNEL